MKIIVTKEKIYRIKQKFVYIYENNHNFTQKNIKEFNPCFHGFSIEKITLQEFNSRKIFGELK